MITIYGYAASINVRKVLWMCTELDLAFTRDDWDGRLVRATQEPAFRALSPVGMVPVVDDAGVIVWESNVIVRYLAASRGRVDLLPTSAAERARVEQWIGDPDDAPGVRARRPLPRATARTPGVRPVRARGMIVSQ